MRDHRRYDAGKSGNHLLSVFFYIIDNGGARGSYKGFIPLAAERGRELRRYLGPYGRFGYIIKAEPAQGRNYPFKPPVAIYSGKRRRKAYGRVKSVFYVSGSALRIASYRLGFLRAFANARAAEHAARFFYVSLAAFHFNGFDGARAKTAIAVAAAGFTGEYYFIAFHNFPYLALCYVR